MAENDVRTIPTVRVNLIPPEIAARRQTQRVQVLAAAMVAGMLFLVLLVWFIEARKLTTAESDLAAAKRQQTELTARRAELKSVDELVALQESREGQLTSAMGEEVLFSPFLNSVQRILPDRVWLTAMSASLLGGSPAPRAGSLVPDSIGSFTFSAQSQGANQDDVATFLEALTLPRGFVFPYVGSIVEGETVGQQVGPFRYSFTTTVQLTPAALSRRFSERGGPNS